jgi:methyltransferase
VTGGPYRFLRHPNYLAVVIELLAAPMMFGAWRTALVIGVLDAFALSVRIRSEDRALGRANLAAGTTALPAGHDD